MPQKQGIPANGIAVTVASAFKEAVDIPAPFSTAVASDAIHGALDAAMKLNGDVRQAAKGIIIGTLHSTRKAGSTQTLKAVRGVAGAVIHHTLEMSGDVGAAARGLVEGVIQSAREAGVDVSQAGSAAASGAFQAAIRLNAATGIDVQEALNTMGGVRVIFKKPLNNKEGGHVSHLHAGPKIKLR